MGGVYIPSPPSIFSIGGLCFFCLMKILIDVASLDSSTHDLIFSLQNLDDFFIVMFYATIQWLVW